MSNRRSKYPATQSEVRYHHDKLYGDIRMIWLEKQPDGRGEHWIYDPDFRPPLPEGAVAGDLSKQNFCPMCHTPRYYYVDQERDCVQCGERFVFSAPEQKFWYESLQFHFRSVAIRCLDCRREKRSDRAVQQELMRATAAAKRAPHDPAVIADWARAAVQARQRTSTGDLGPVIAALRKCQQLAPDSADLQYWEAACQDAEGRKSRALQAYRRFMEAAGGRGMYRNLVREARKQVEKLQ